MIMMAASGPNSGVVGVGDGEAVTLGVGDGVSRWFDEGSVGVGVGELTTGVGVGLLGGGVEGWLQVH